MTLMLKIWSRNSVWFRKYEGFTKKAKNTVKKTVLEAIWDELPQDLAVLAFRKRLQKCIQAEGGHFEHLLK